MSRISVFKMRYVGKSVTKPETMVFVRQRTSLKLSGVNTWWLAPNIESSPLFSLVIAVIVYFFAFRVVVVGFDVGILLIVELLFYIY